MKVQKQNALNKENTFIASMVFTLLRPVNETFASAHITEALTWRHFVFKATDLSEGYLVVFRSKLRKNADRQLITELDDAAYEEAAHQKGFIGYFKGPLNEKTRENLSCCLWATQEDARRAAMQPAHKAATRIVNQMYEYYTLERHKLTVLEKPDGPWIHFEQIQSQH